MKRFTDTGIWQDEWFMNLSSEHKLAYMFLKDNCDNAGIWKPNKKLANLMIGIDINWDEFLIECGARIRIIKNNYWWIVKFCDFQYGTLTETCRPHQKVLEILNKYGLDIDYTKGIDTLKEEEKEKDKEEEEDKGGVGEKINFAKNVKMTNAEFAKLVEKHGNDFTIRCVEVLDNYKGSKGKTYKDDYRAILSWVVDRVMEEKNKNTGQSSFQKLAQQSNELRDFYKNQPDA